MTRVYLGPIDEITVRTPTGYAVVCIGDPVPDGVDPETLGDCWGTPDPKPVKGATKESN